MIKKNKSKELNLASKREIAQILLRGAFSIRDLAKQFNTSKSTIGRISKKAIFYLSIPPDELNGIRQRYSSKYDSINNKIMKTFIKLRNQNISVTKKMFKTMAIEINKIHNNNEFKFSNFWFERFFFSLKLKGLKYYTT